LSVVTREDVLRAATLARLALEPAEVDRLTTELAGILEHVAVMSRLDLSDVPPYEATAGSAAELREDLIGPDPLGADPSTFAPGWWDGFFTVPRLRSHREPGEG
jgi:aspartyl-tRNA(Asn)/glutamyl-tRNA(Gln) amidotransferase subunit C